MPRSIQADGRTIVVPDDATDDEINQLFGPSANTNTPTATLSAAPPDSWLHQAENDYTEGGNRTILGRVLGRMQGRGDQGYRGINSGVSEGTANILGSPLRGLLHAGESAQTIPDHPVKGALGTIGGLAESLTIPSMIMGGPAASTAIDAIPSAKYAGKIFNSLGEDLATHSVPLTDSTLQPLQRATELGARGGTLPKPVSDLLTRSQGLEPMSYPEIRDYQSNLSDLSRDAQGSMNGKMLGQMGKLKSGLYNDIYNAASQVGRGDDYAQAMKEFRQASQIKSGAKTAAKVGAKYALPAGGLGALVYKAFK